MVIAGYMLDTSLCIELLRRPNRALRSRFNAERGRLHLSTVALAELLFGPMRRPGVQFRENLEALLGRLKVVHFDAGAARHSADIRADLERRGLPIGPYDLQLAGHARSLNMVLVTRNMREFSRVEALRCEDWIEPVQGFSE